MLPLHIVTFKWKNIWPNVTVCTHRGRVLNSIIKVSRYCLDRYWLSKQITGWLWCFVSKGSLCTRLKLYFTKIKEFFLRIKCSQKSYVKYWFRSTFTVAVLESLLPVQELSTYCTVMLNCLCNTALIVIHDATDFPWRVSHNTPIIRWEKKWKIFTVRYRNI